VDPAEAHRLSATATGQAYRPPLEEHAFVEPDSAQAVDPGDSAALVEPIRLPAAEALTGVIPAANSMAQTFRGVLDALEQFAANASGLLDVLEDLVDDDGREIWLTATEVELDQWAARVIEERNAVRRSLRGLAGPS
jgi:hypothetical protein